MYKFLLQCFIISLGAFTPSFASDVPSEVLPFSSVLFTEKNYLRDYVINQIKASPLSIHFATDQFTEMATAQALADSSPDIPKYVLVGDNDKEGGPEVEATILQVANLTFTPRRFEGCRRMHNKFLIFKFDEINGMKLFTGSPNLTQGAFNYNIESQVIIAKNDMLANLYATYFDRIARSTFDDDLDKETLKNSIEEFNLIVNPPTIKICLAPYTPILDFIWEEIKDAKKLEISMFLFSRGSPHMLEPDIINRLVELNNNGVPITIKYDAKHKRDPTFAFTERAIKYLHEKSQGRIEMYSIKVKKGFLHDKLILITGTDVDKNKIITGSAGFSTSVQDNKNYENMISIQDNSIFCDFKKHFDEINLDHPKVSSYIKYFETREANLI